MKWILRAMRRITERLSQKRGGDYPHFHWGTLMDDRGGCDRCPIYSGRCWWRASDNKSINLEWHWFTIKNYRLGVSLTVGGGESGGDVQVNISVPWLCNTYATWEGYRSERPEREWAIGYLLSREYGDWGTFQFAFARLGDYWGDRKLWPGMSRWIDVADAVMGRNEYRCEEVARWEPEDFILVVPWNGKTEEYPVRATIERRTWTRTRWPFRNVKQERLSLDVDSKQGIPIPGKGENSWDLGDDAFHGLGATITGTSRDDVMAGCNKIVAAIIKQRQRYGGEGWMPRPVTVN